MYLPLQTFTDSTNVYSVDMMLAYVNTKKPQTIKLLVKDLLPQLETNNWGDTATIDGHGKKDDETRYTSRRYQEADTSIPIIVVSSRTSSIISPYTIVDGYHRVAKANRQGKTTIDAYFLDRPVLNKFVLDTLPNANTIKQKTSLRSMLELWDKRICNTPLVYSNTEN